MNLSDFHNMDFFFIKNDLLDTGQIVDISKHAQAFSFLTPVCITMDLYKDLFPVAEEMQKGLSFTERCEDMVRLFRQLPDIKKSKYTEFYFKFDTYLKEYKSFDEIKCWPTRHDRSVKCFATVVVDTDLSEPNILFGKSVE